MTTRKIFYAVFLAGIASLQMELSVLREVSFTLGTTAFTNGFIISVFLGGLAIGSYLGNWLLRVTEMTSERIFVWSQLSNIVVVFIFLATKNYIVYGSLTQAPILLYFSLFTFLPATVAGMSFSLFLNMLYTHGEKHITLVYAISTIGNVLGGLMHGFLVMSVLGLNASYAIIVATTGLAVLFIRQLRTVQTVGAIVALMVATGFVSQFRLYPAHIESTLLYSQDDRYGLVEVFDASESRTARGDARAIDVHIHGQYNCGNSEEDLARHEVSGHVSHALAGGKPTGALLLGYCSGSTIDALLEYDAMNHIVAVEQNQTSLAMARQFFPEISKRVLDNPRVKIEVDEFKRYLKQSARESRFDIVMIDITVRDPYFLGLFTVEFFRMIKNHLKEGGVSSFNFALNHFVRTAAEVFEHVYMAESGSAEGWFFLTDRVLGDAELATHQLVEVFPKQEDGIVMTDHRLIPVKGVRQRGRPLQ